MLVAVEVGRRQILPDSLSIGLRVVGAGGAVAFNGADEARAAPATPDVASPLHYIAEVPLAAGRYRLRVAVVDGAGREAFVEHAFAVAGLPASEPARAGALMIGPAPLGGALRPLARSDIVRAGAVAWTDVAAAAAPSARLEILDTAGGAVLAAAAADVEAGPAGSKLARATMPVELLPPGAYVASLSVTVGGRSLVRTRPFTLGRLPPPEASALGDIVTAAVGPFVVGDVLAPGVLGPVLTRALEADPSGADDAMRAAVATVSARGVKGIDVKPFTRRADLPALMLRGAILLDRGKLEDAARAFRDALRVSSEFLPAITYLGACYAAGGRDREAVGAWQTALVTEHDSPLVFTLAADGLVRLGDSAQALSLVAEAAERWPDETALVRRHVLAMAGREGPAHAVDAVLTTLEQAGSVDPDLLALVGRLAVASAARGDDKADERVARLNAVASRAGQVPPLLARWHRFFSGGHRSRGAVPTYFRIPTSPFHVSSALRVPRSAFRAGIPSTA